MAPLAAGLLVSLSLAAPAVAQTPDETGDYAGSADASVLDLTAVDTTEEFDEFTLLDASVAPTETAADTQDGLTFAEEEGLTAYGYGANVSGELAGELGGAGPVEVLQTAPPDNEEPESETLIEIPADPLLEMETFSGEALARDVGTVACPEDDVASFGWSQVDDTRLFPGQAEGEDVAHLGGVVDTRSEVSLVDVEGQETRGVQAQATSSAASLDLFGGQEADAVTIDVLSEPTLTAVAGGTPGSAEVTRDLPVVQINGEGLDANETQEFSIPPDAETGEDLLVRVAYGSFEETTAEDGTHASGSASVLHIEILRSVDMGTLAEIELMPMNVEADAPAGGVDCPAAPAEEPDEVTVTKDGPEEVDAGDEFDYTIEVTNDLDCTLVDLVVVDELTGPDGTEITATEPEGNVDGTTVTWDDLDDLESGASVTLTMTVSVPDDAEPGATYRDEVTVTADCDGEPVEGGDVIERPAVADDEPEVLPGDVEQEPDDDAGPARTLPATGGGLGLAGLVLLLAVAAVRRRG